MKLGTFQRNEEVGHDAENHSAGHRFTPVGYGTPDETTIVATVSGTEPEAQYFQAKLTLAIPGETGATPA